MRLASRRAMLMAAAGGVGAFVASVFGRAVPESRAAAGGNLVLGASNSAGSSQTVLTSSAGGAAFTLKDTAPAGTGIFGWSSAATGAGRALYGRVDSPDGHGLQARNNGAAGTGAAIQAIGGNNHGVDASTAVIGRVAVNAFNPTGVAIDGVSTGSGPGIRGSATNGFGVLGISSSITGVAGQSTTGYGVSGSSGLVGVYGQSPSGSGVYGTSTSGYGVYAFSASNAAVYATSTSGYSGYFVGSLWAQSLNASAKAFRIDHPQDPQNKALMHSCVESNERLTVYAGVAVTGATGEATVELPAWFDALNRDIRYQLTVIGTFAQAIVKREIAGNRFTIATSEPRTKVSWQVTGVRQDAYAKAHPLEVESVKTGREQGRYITPKEHGQPLSAGVDAAMRELR